MGKPETTTSRPAHAALLRHASRLLAELAEQGAPARPVTLSGTLTITVTFSPAAPCHEERYLNAEEVIQYLCISKRTLLRWIQAGKFPKPIHLNNSRRLPRWPVSVVERYAQERQS